MKKIVLVILLMTSIFSSPIIALTDTPKKIRFAIPFAPVSYPVIKMVENQIWKEKGIHTKLIIWKTPDQLRALVAGQQADFFAIPSNVAATFYNKGIKLKLLNISIWRAIWLVSRSNEKKTLSDFRGEEITMPFKGDMPHIVFMELAKKQGLDPEKDFELNYVATPMDAAQRIIMRRTNHALLVDPAVSTVIQKTKSGLISYVAPTVYRSVDLQNEWGRLFKTDNEIPFAGIMAGSQILHHKDLLWDFIKQYKTAAQWCMDHPEQTAKMVVKYIPQLNEKALVEAMRFVTLKGVNAVDAKERLENFFKVLHNSRPDLIGGKLPDDSFYFIP